MQEERLTSTTHVKHLLLVALFTYVSLVANGILSFVMGYVAFVLVPLVGVLLLFRGPGRPWTGAGVLLGTSAWWVLILSGG